MVGWLRRFHPPLHRWSCSVSVGLRVSLLLPFQGLPAPGKVCLCWCLLLPSSFAFPSSCLLLLLLVVVVVVWPASCLLLPHCCLPPAAFLLLSAGQENIMALKDGITRCNRNQMSSNVLFPGALPLASAGVGGYVIICYNMLQLALFPICQARVSRFYLNFPLFLILRPSPRQVAKIISQRASFLASTSLPASSPASIPDKMSERVRI